MKKVPIILAILFAMTIKVNAQIPNSGFENWTTTGSYENPTGWASTNSYSTGSFYPVTKSTDHYPASVGAYSVRIENNTSLITNGSGKGLIVIGTAYGANPSFPIIGHPTSLTGYYKFAPLNGDTMYVEILLYKNGESIPVTDGEFTSTASTSGWTSFNIPFRLNYTSADSACIIIAPWYANGYNDVPHGNSVLYIDNLNFDNLITPVSGQTSKSVNVTAGGLSLALTTDEKNTITKLTVTGTIDARDFKTMRDDMPLLAEIDLSGANVVEYNGTQGTYNTDVTDYPANTIPRNAFLRKEVLTSAILPNTLIAIGRSSFNQCSDLTFINIPSKVTSIGYAAFNFCSSLSSVNIPSSVTLIDTWAFGYCNSLKSINIPSTVTAIGSSAFNNSGLQTVSIPEGTVTIGDYAFQNCALLTSASIPSSVTYIGYCAFTFDNALTTIDVSGNNANYISTDGVLYSKSQQKLLCFPGGKSADFIIPTTVSVVDTAAFEGSYVIRNIVIPSSVTTLSPEAFYWCPNLKTIDIPASVTSIGGYVFYNCTGLTSIQANAATPVDLSASDSVFNFIDKNNCILYVPAGSKALYQAANQWKDFSNIVELNNKTISVSTGGLYSALTSTELINITNLTITGTIDARDFKTMRDNMPLLTDIDISGVIIVSYSGTDGPNDGYTTYAANAIPDHAFFTQSTGTGKTTLHSIQLPPTITKIEGAAFTSSGLTGITLPNGVITIDDWAFANCNLNSVYLPATLSSIGLCAFSFNNSLASFQVAEDNPYLTAVDGVLYDKTEKTVICYPNGKIGTTYQIPEGVTVVDKSAFAGWCLEEVFIPATVTTLSMYAFDENGNLKTIDIPASVTFIGESAFKSCTGLTSITVHSTFPIDLSSSNDVFLNVDKATCTLYVPAGSKALYQAANQWKDFVNIVEFSPDNKNELKPGGIKVFPNLVTVGFHITGIDGLTKLTLSDINGKIWLSKEIRCNEYIPTNYLRKGIYFVRVVSSKEQITQKLVVN